MTDIKAKYNLHKLHKVTKVNRFISWGTVSSIALVILLTVAYVCRNHLPCGRLEFPAITMNRSNETPVSLTELQPSIASSETLFTAPNIPMNANRTKRNR